MKSLPQEDMEKWYTDRGFVLASNARFVCGETPGVVQLYQYRGHGVLPRERVARVANEIVSALGFDLLVVPGANHPAGRGNDPTAPYGDRKRFDFFVQHLLGAMPPRWNRPESTTSIASRPQ